MKPMTRKWIFRIVMYLKRKSPFFRGIIIGPVLSGSLLPWCAGFSFSGGGDGLQTRR